MLVEVKQSTIDDLEMSCWLFEQAIEYQRRMGFLTYVLVDRDSHRMDIERGESFKILIDGDIAMMFSLCQQDELIWGHMPNIPSLFLHKATTHPAHRGKALFQHAVRHAIEVAKANGLKALRMDTWAESSKLIALYVGYGFIHLEDYHVPDKEGIPLNTRGNNVALLEMKLGDG